MIRCQSSMNKLLLAFSFLVMSGQLACSQSFDSAKLDAYFEQLENHEKFMGSVVLSKDGEVIYSRSMGYLDFEAGIKADERTKYRIGSITKTITAALVLKAVEENLLSPNQPIGAYFPSITHADKITIGNLLNHRSGIHNFTSNEDYLEWNTQPKTAEELVAIIAASGSDFEPDSKASYSNSNYVLLTYILENVYGKPYAELVEKHIAEPLGLANTYVSHGIDPANSEAHSYSFQDVWVRSTITDPSIPVGAGAIVSTPVDIIKFGEALFSGKVISEAHLTLMKTIQDGYGMGLFQIPFHERSAFGHTGGIDGFSSTWGYFPEEHVSMAITSNGSVTSTNNVAVALLSAFFDKPYDIPVFYEEDEEALAQYVGIYSSTQLPIKITISKSGKALVAQATGQPSFPLEATGKDQFGFDEAGVELVFNPAEGTMVLKQGGGEFLFTREP